MILIALIMDTEKSQVLKHNSSARITIPEKWRRELNLEPGTECHVAKVHGKHGLFFAVWADDQPTLDDLGDEL